MTTYTAGVYGLLADPAKPYRDAQEETALGKRVSLAHTSSLLSSPEAVCVNVDYADVHCSQP